MYFKALEMKGFKSFVDDIKLDFSPGVTSIVGPNGCGKSNIYDAIRWVLGEQSPKLLRGKKMEDLIFNGTQSRKPHGAAEVSLVMGNLNGELPSEWGNFDEIRITRRLFRDGESEYLINKIPCRLKDIVEIFLDTGVSSQAFSLIEQGQVGAIINSKPENRRSLIEEAAGIIKYKHKKEIALRKLEHSHQNLLRLNDIVSEISRQVNSLRRQAKKAERYKEYQKKIRELELSLFSRKYLTLKGDLGVQDSEFEKIRRDETELSAKNSSLENKMENIKFNIVEGEKELSQVKGKAFEIAAEADRTENRIERLKEQIEDIKTEKQRNDSEIDFLRNKLDEVQEEIGKLREEKEGCLREIESQESVIADKKEELRVLEERIGREESLLDEKKAFHVDILSQVAQEKNQIGSLENKLENLQYAKERLDEELAGDQERYRELEQGLEQGKKNNVLVNERLDKIREERNAVAKDLESFRLERESLDDKINDLQSELAAKTSRLKSLEELESNLEGYEGVRYLLRSENGSSQIQGIHGVVADFLETSQEYEVALSSVLGEKLQSLVMENHENIEKAIDCLKSNEKGRGTFIPMNPKILNDNPVHLNGEQGVVGKALDLITYKENYKGVLEFLLRDVVVVKDFSVALELYASGKPPCTLVTLSGDILEPSGVAVGGNVKGNANLQLLKKKRVMRELSNEVDQGNIHLAEKKELKSDVCRQIDECKAALEAIEEKQAEIERESLELGKDLQHMEEEYTRIKKRVDLFDFEKGKLREEEEQIDKKIAEIRQTLISLTEKEKQSEEEIGRFQEALAGLHQERESFKSGLSEMTVALTSLIGKKENCSLKCEQITEKKRDIEGRIEDLRSDSIKREERAQENVRLISELEVSLKGLFDEKRIIEESLVEKEEAVSEQKKDLESLETETKVFRREIDELKGRLNEIEIRRTELETRMTSIRERVSQEYGLSMENLLEREQEDFSPEEREQELGELKERLARLGDVNLTALEEYQTLDARLRFLSEQKEDLVQSIDALNDVIDKMNRKTKSLFKETFDAVNRSFQEIFPRLFEGGKGELVLTDEHNLLETGLDILVQPAGKRLQNITLLSAGEKALTAISLLFSIFLVKPGPFCLLDEVDAPLDESNIERFAGILRELSQRTQFIIITHNKRTMSFADVLYGVTMEEEGVSKVVSLQLNEKS